MERLRDDYSNLHTHTCTVIPNIMISNIASQCYNAIFGFQHIREYANACTVLEINRFERQQALTLKHSKARIS
eukprot:UN00764